MKHRKIIVQHVQKISKVLIMQQTSPNYMTLYTTGLLLVMYE